MDQQQQRSRCGHILSLGSINADFQVRVERRPAIGETLLGQSYRRLGGGKAANVAFLCARLGARAMLFGHVGDDELAEQALAPLRSAGVDLSGVTPVAGLATGMAMIMVPPDGKKGIVLASNANDAWTDEDTQRIASALREAPAGSVLVADCEVAVAGLEQAMRTARQRGAQVVLDPSPADRVTQELLALSDVVLPNNAEARALTGIDCSDAKSSARAASRLRSLGARAACVKLGDGGCVLDDGTHRVHVRSLPVQVVDTTGAGDAFAGALAFSLSRRHGLASAVRFAAAASQLAVTGYGSQPAYPALEEIEALSARLEVETDGERQD